MLLRDNRCHGEGGAGLLLTLGTMTGVDDFGWSGNFVTNRAALTPSGLWKTHGPLSLRLNGTSRSWPPNRRHASIQDTTDGKRGNREKAAQSITCVSKPKQSSCPTGTLRLLRCARNDRGIDCAVLQRFWALIDSHVTANGKTPRRGWIASPRRPYRSAIIAMPAE